VPCNQLIAAARLLCGVSHWCDLTPLGFEVNLNQSLNLSGCESVSDLAPSHP
jgi:hypothetical protein